MFRKIIFTVFFILILPVAALAQVETAEPVSLERALEKASMENKKILVDVYAAWCPYCQRMHSDVYTSEEVLKAISDYFIWVQINVESDKKVTYHGTEMTEAEFARALDNKNVPTTYFLNDEGAIIGVQPGYLDDDVFANLLNFVGSDAYLNTSFEEYVNRR
jgi:thioredoxin-related protein